ncbi:LOW QUALITY PROTEIN: hypothetical protein ACG7TL_004205 [Trametes sanguinea]
MLGRLSGEELSSYFQSFAHKFLDGKILYGKEVQQIRRDASGDGWEVDVLSIGDGTTETRNYARIVLCTGGCSNPRIPHELSPKAAVAAGFTGPVIHTAEFAERMQELLTCARPATSVGAKFAEEPSVIVVGGGKSAHDMCASLANEGRKVTMVCHNLDYFLASTSPLPEFIRKSRLVLEHFQAAKIPKGSPLRNVASPFWSVRANDEGVPRPNGFHALALAGKIEVITPAHVAGFGQDGKSVVLEDGRRLAASAVVLATGYRSSWEDLFDETVIQRAWAAERTLEEVGLNAQPANPRSSHRWSYSTLSNPPPLHPDAKRWSSTVYRGIVPAKNIMKRNLAVNGTGISMNNGYTAEVVAHWISSYFLRDPMRLPDSTEAALAATEREAAWLKQRHPQTPTALNPSYTAYLSFLSWPQYTDDLLEDMGLRVLRSGGNGLTWPFKVIDLDEIGDLKEERDARRARIAQALVTCHSTSMQQDVNENRQAEDWTIYEAGAAARFCSTSPEMSPDPRCESVAIIGAGIIGLITAHILLDDGFTDVQVLTRDNEVGGIWARSRIYPGLYTNIAYGEFRYSSLKMAPPSLEECPDGRLPGQHLCEYFNAFASRFLKGRIQFGKEVQRIRRNAVGGGWKMDVQDGSSLPKMPDALTPEAAYASGFKGLVMHTAEFAAKMDQLLSAVPLDAPSVVVVGGGKSAQERFLHTTWIGGLIVRFLWYILVEYATNDDCNLASAAQFLATGVPRGSPLRNVTSPFWSVRVNDEGGPRPNGFHKLAVAGKIDVITPATVAGFGEDGESVVLNDGRVLRASALVLGTGYKSSWDNLFDEATMDELGIGPQPAQLNSTDRWDYTSLYNPPPLHPDAKRWSSAIYRGIVPAKNILRRDLAVSGTGISVNNGYSGEVTAHWISSYFLRDPMRLPGSIEEALVATEREAAWLKRRYPQIPTALNGSYTAILPFLAWPQYVDDLLEDMGLAVMRSGGIVLTWPFKLIDADELKTLKQERDARRAAAKAKIIA